MRRSLRKALALSALLALSASWAAGWAVALHAVSDHAHDGRSSTIPARAVEWAVHGHLHAEDTPEHGHPVVATAPASVSARVSLTAPAPAVAWAGLDVAARTANAGLPGEGGPNHDPPPRGRSVTILRI